MQDYARTVRETYGHIHDEMEELRRAGHKTLSWRQMPSKKNLRMHGFTGRIPGFYFGSSTNTALANLYVAAEKAGQPVSFNRIILNKLTRDGHPEIMQRFQMSTSTLPLFKGLAAPAQHATFHRLMDARRALGLDAIKDDLALQMSHGKVLKYVLSRNHLQGFGEMTAASAMLFLIFHSANTSTRPKDGEVTGPGFSNWGVLNVNSRLSFYQAGRTITAAEIAKSFPWRFYTAFTLDELDQLIAANLPDWEHWYTALLIRERVDATLPVMNLLEYLQMSLSIVYAMLPQLSQNQKFNNIW